MTHNPWELTNQREQIKAQKAERDRIANWKQQHLAKLAEERRIAQQAIRDIKNGIRKPPTRK